MRGDWREERRERIRRALGKMPLEVVMRHYGHWAAEGAGMRLKGGKCPFCGKQAGGYYVVKGSGKGRFKCHHRDCPTGGRVLNEITYVAEAEHLDDKAAFKRFMELAGEWEEPRRETKDANRESRRIDAKEEGKIKREEGGPRNTGMWFVNGMTSKILRVHISYSCGWENRALQERNLSALSARRWPGHSLATGTSRSCCFSVRMPLQATA